MNLDLALLSARAEFYDLALPTRRFLDYVHEHRLDLGLISGFAGGTGILEIADCGQRRFDWSADGERFPAFICEAYDRDGETTIDLVAWPLDQPTNVLSMFGRAAWLGAWQAWNPASYYMGGKALNVHRCPLDWLKAECAGAAVVNPRLAARELIDLPGPIAGQDDQHGRELLAMAESLIDRSRILVPSSTRRKAA